MKKETEVVPEIPDCIITTQEAADLLGVTKATILRWINEGEIIGVKKFGDIWILHKDFKIKSTLSTKAKVEFMKRCTK